MCIGYCFYLVLFVSPPLFLHLPHSAFVVAFTGNCTRSAVAAIGKSKNKGKNKNSKNDPWQERKKKQEQAKRGRREKRKRCGFEVRAERLSSGWFMFYAATSSPFDLNVRCLSVINEITLLLFFGVSCFCFFTCIFYYIS